MFILIIFYFYDFIISVLLSWSKIYEESITIRGTKFVLEFRTLGSLFNEESYFEEFHVYHISYLWFDE